jgi:hypothetical protein
MSRDQLFSLTEERRRRQEVVGDATASGWELSGIKMDPPTQERARLSVEGRLPWHEFCDLQR